jgi:hypothetical protein
MSNIEDVITAAALAIEDPQTDEAGLRLHLEDLVRTAIREREFTVARIDELIAKANAEEARAREAIGEARASLQIGASLIALAALQAQTIGALLAERPPEGGEDFNGEKAVRLLYRLCGEIRPVSRIAPDLKAGAKADIFDRVRAILYPPPAP